jgi:ABC-type multidrug transport system fused ATPase/permease subunit
MDQLLAPSFYDPTSLIGMFMVSFKLLKGNYIPYFVSITIYAMMDSLPMWALMLKQPMLVICAPIVSTIYGYFFAWYLMRLQGSIKQNLMKSALDHLHSLPYIERQKIDNEEIWRKKVDRMTQVVYNVIDWGMVSTVGVLVSCVTSAYAFATATSLFDLSLVIAGYAIFYAFVVRKMQLKIGHQQDELLKKREHADLNVRLFVGQMKNHERTVADTLPLFRRLYENESELDIAWVKAARTVNMFNAFVAMCVLWNINDWTTFIVMFAVIQNFVGEIGSLNKMLNSLNMNRSEWMEYITWFNKCPKSAATYPQYQLPANGLVIDNINITISSKNDSGNTSDDDATDGTGATGTGHVAVPESDEEATSSTGSTKTFHLTGDRMHLKHGQVILVRGNSGTGKTTFLNALMGLIDGVTFAQHRPENYWSIYGYLYQKIREAIPNSGISLRSLLRDEADDRMIADLVALTRLTYKFPTADSYDTPIEYLSGGEKMRLAIIYTLHRVERGNKDVLILDEPEQGIDTDETLPDLIKDIIQRYQGRKIILIVSHMCKCIASRLPFTHVITAQPSGMQAPDAPHYVGEITMQPFRHVS